MVRCVAVYDRHVLRGIVLSEFRHTPVVATAIGLNHPPSVHDQDACSAFLLSLLNQGLGTAAQLPQGPNLDELLASLPLSSRGETSGSFHGTPQPSSVPLDPARILQALRGLEALGKTIAAAPAPADEQVPQGA